MQFMRVREADAEWLEGQPETLMALQVIRASPQQSELVYVLGGLIALEITETRSVAQLPPFEAMARNANSQAASTEFERWRAALPELSLGAGRQVLSLGHLGPKSPGPLPLPPFPPPWIYGHLPFHHKCGADDVFYRWEPWPTSRRVNPVSKKVAQNTFAAPQSEVPMVPSGFAAVGRFALPFLPPSCFRWEMRPPAGTNFRCGASVPLYGQAGGGVEVEFGAGFTNVGPIANPVYVPAL